MKEVYQKENEFCNGTKKPLLLFIEYGHDEKGNFVSIHGVKNPLPIKKAYGINPVYLNTWLYNNGWIKIGHSF